MARSTIQEKISGTSSANLSQVLSIVEALAEYSRLTNAPLPAQETDQSVWRERVTASFKQASREASTAESVPQLENHEKPWNVGPLIHAQMYDLIEIVESSRQSPTDTWLPSVIGPMLKAQMSVSSFMERAAQDDPKTVVRTVYVLNLSFPPPPLDDDPWSTTGSPWAATDNNLTVGHLLRHAARHQGVDSAPALIVGMRRADIGGLVNIYITALAQAQNATGIQKANALLRAASLDRDAVSLLRLVGSLRGVSESLKVADRFHENNQTEYRDLVLQGISEGGAYGIKGALSAIQGRESEEEYKLEILRSIPHGKHEMYARTLSDSGSLEIAQIVREAANIPPF
ncbi:hypothetical protein OG496_33470 [Streptomyces sp. NBC_00988]|uniref:hypothetical protein n=1 Tax=Streptomyces sp. NBC_00988 TaxID=2903704 RepID=UPI00386F5963|nr:hypothetical protein OG496_33470 [Streptomyces sp. NBC_00988]